MSSTVRTVPSRAVRSRVSLIGLVVSVICVGGVVWWASKQETPDLPSTAGQLAWLVGAIAIYTFNTLLRAERWQRLLEHDGATPRRSDALALTVAGYAGNNVLPARAGDAVRVVLMAPRAKTSRRTVVGTLLAERLLDIAVIVLLFVTVGFGALLEVGGGDIEVVGLVAAGLVVAGLLALLLVRRNRKLHDFLGPILSSTLGLRSRFGAVMFLLTAAIWGIETTVWMAVGAAVDFDMSYLEGLYLVALASVFALIPSGPAYAGTQDSAVVIGMKAIGGSSSLALSYLLILRFVLVVPITVAGFIALAARYGGISKLRRARLDAEVAEASSP
jgi:uncharacterized membrane protein YbhN (UPF0104 family)